MLFRSYGVASGQFDAGGWWDDDGEPLHEAGVRIVGYRALPVPPACFEPKEDAGGQK